MTLTKKLTLTGLLLGLFISTSTLAGFWPFGNRDGADEACSKISHVYDKILTQEPANSQARGNNWILTAQVKAELLKQAVLEQNRIPLLKTVSFDGVVFLLGRHGGAAEQIKASVQSIAGVKRVVPLWVE